MAKKKSSSRQTANKQRPSDSTRKTLSALDQDLIKQLQERAKLIRKLPKSQWDKALFELANPLRIAKLAQKNSGPLEDECLTAMFRELASGIRSSLQPARVTFLGPLHSYSHLATLRKFGQSAELVAVRTIAAVFEEVSREHVDAGVVPIENSTDGRIVDTLEMFTRCSAKICGEIPLRIHHHLLGKGTRAGVVEICSKPQALSQCRDWLANHLPNATITPTTSTTAAAERAAAEAGVAAIASQQAGVEYGLKVLAKHIEDNPDNITRFAVIGRTPAPRTGNDKTSLMLEISHQSGALADTMAIFKRNRLNLTWIESFPKPGSPNEYLFFIELEGHHRDLRVRRALSALAKKAVRLEVLGSYAKTAPVE